MKSAGLDHFRATPKTRWYVNSHPTIHSPSTLFSSLKNRYGLYPVIAFYVGTWWILKSSRVSRSLLNIFFSPSH